MEITGIIFFSLLIAYTLLTIFKETYQNKWYRRGYTDACYKYDNKDDYRNQTYSQEANDEFHKQYGFHYD